jgi:hypothetical protein
MLTLFMYSPVRVSGENLGTALDTTWIFSFLVNIFSMLIVVEDFVVVSIAVMAECVAWPLRCSGGSTLWCRII